MSILVPVVNDGGFIRRLASGDILAGGEPPIPATDTTNTTLSYTAANLLSSTVYARNPAGVSTDTFPTADALITALSAGIGAANVVPGMTFRWRIINLSANLLTGAVTANTGVTMTRGNVLASTTKDFLITITNGTPLRTCTGITSTNASAVLTGFTDTDIKNLSVGMVVTNAVAGQQGNTIIGINAASNSVTMSGNSNATGTISPVFSPTYTIVGLSA